jgi:hypothetical protein
MLYDARRAASRLFLAGGGPAFQKKREPAPEPGRDAIPEIRGKPKRLLRHKNPPVSGQYAKKQASLQCKNGNKTVRRQEHFKVALRLSSAPRLSPGTG